jgi:hypothetical protein
MDKNAALEVLSRFKKGIECRGIRVDKLILFGSYVTGANREGVTSTLSSYRRTLPARISGKGHSYSRTRFMKSLSP